MAKYVSLALCYRKTRCAGGDRQQDRKFSTNASLGRHYLLACLSAAYMGLAICAFAMTTDYVSVQNGLWHDSATWTNLSGMGAYPTTSDSARVLHQITVQRQEEVAHLFMQGGTLDIQDLAGVRVTGTSVLHRATLQGAGGFRNQGVMLVTGAPPTTIDLLLENEGRIELIQTPSLQFSDEIRNRTNAFFAVNGPGECSAEGGGRFRNEGWFGVGNNTTLVCVNASFFVNRGTIGLGTNAVLKVYGRGETNAYVSVFLATNAAFFPVYGGTAFYDHALSGYGPGVIGMRTGVLVMGHGGTTMWVNVEGGGFQWEGGTINVHPAYQMINGAQAAVLLGRDRTNSASPLLQGNLVNTGHWQIVGYDAGGTSFVMWVAGGNVYNRTNAYFEFKGTNPAIAGSGHFFNYGTTLFAPGTTGRVAMFFRNEGGTFLVANASAQLPNGFYQPRGHVGLQNGQLIGASFFLQGGTFHASGQMKGNTYHSSGTISPGQSPGSLQADGFYEQSGTGNLLIELGGETPGTGYDQFQVASNAVLGGILTVELFGGYDPPAARRFDILTAASVASNRFAVTNLPPLAGDRQWLVLYRTNGVQLRVATSQDADGDALQDAWETLHFGNIFVSDGGDEDYDRDGFSDYFEQICDTQPTNNMDYLRWKAMSLGPSGAELTVHTGSNAQYTVEVASELVPNPVWTNAEQFTGTGRDVIYTNRVSGDPSFFRLKASP